MTPSGMELATFRFEARSLPLRTNIILACIMRDWSIGIARYLLDGPGIESRWGRDFPRSFRTILAPTQPPVQWIPGLFPGGKSAEAWLLPSPHLTPRLKKE